MASPAASDALSPTHERLLRERRFPVAVLPFILPLLRAEAATGRLVLDLSQGAVCAVSFQERTSSEENT